MRRCSLRFVFLVLAALLSLLLSGWMWEKTWKLEYKYRPGDTFHYKMYVDSEAQIGIEGRTRSVSTHSETELIQNVLSVRDGVINLNETIRPLFRSLNRQAVKIPEERIFSLKMDALGRPVEGLHKSSVGHILPERPLKVGESWTGQSTLNVPSGVQPFSLKTRNTLLGVVKRGSYECAQIKIELQPVTLTIPDTAGAKNATVTLGSGGGTLYFAVRQGMVVESKGEADLLIKAEARNVRRGRSDSAFRPLEIRTHLKFSLSLQ